MSNEKHLIKKITYEMFSQNDTKTEYYKFGMKYLGPFLVGYTKWLQESLMDAGIKNVFFFSRDGYMMEKAFRVIEDAYDTEYIYFSRNSIRHALLHFCDSYENIIALLPQERYITTACFLEFLGVSKKEHLIITETYGLILNENHKFDGLLYNEKLKKLYYLLKKKIDRYSVEQDVLLEKYLKQMRLSGKCAIVDIGWHGSMQYYLERYCEYKKIDVEILGLYIGIRPEWPLTGKVKGYLYEPEDLHMRKSVLCFFGGYEKFLQKPEGSVYEYQEREGKVEPILYPFEYEEDESFMELLRDIQEGSIDFLRKVYQKEGLVEQKRTWAKPLVKFGKYPSNRELQLFKCFYNVDGKKAYYISQKPIYQYGLKELKYALSNSVWKTGFMKSLFRVPFPYYWVYYLLRK